MFKVIKVVVSSILYEVGKEIYCLKGENCSEFVNCGVFCDGIW